MKKKNEKKNIWLDRKAAAYIFCLNHFEMSFF